MKRLRIDLLAPPFSGHLYPILALARALQQTHEVRVISTLAVQARIREAGLAALALPEGWDARLQDIANPQFAVGGNPWRLHRQFSVVLGHLLQLKTDLLALYREDRPDLLIADFTLVTAGVVARELGIAWWTSLPSPCVLETAGAPPAYLGGWRPLPGIIGSLRDRLGWLCVRGFKRSIAWLYRAPLQRAGIAALYREDGSEAAYSDACILVFGLRALEFPARWPQAACFTGPMLYTPPLPAERLRFVPGRTHVLVTMGTHLDWIKERVAAEVRRVAARMPMVEFHFTDGRIGGDGGQFEDNFSRVPFIDYARYLPRYQVVLHHGGSGILYYCLQAGRPAVVYPADYDQFDNAARLVHAGLAYRMQVLDQMERLLRQALSDRAMTQQCAEYARLIGSSSPQQAVQDHLQPRLADLAARIDAALAGPQRHS